MSVYPFIEAEKVEQRNVTKACALMEVSRTKKATARFKISRSSRASRSSLRSWAISDSCSLVRPSERRP